MFLIVFLLSIRYVVSKERNQQFQHFYKTVFTALIRTRFCLRIHSAENRQSVAFEFIFHLNSGVWSIYDGCTGLMVVLEDMGRCSFLRRQSGMWGLSVWGSHILPLELIGFAHKRRVFYISVLYNENTLLDIINLNILEILLTFNFFTDISFFERTEVGVPEPRQCA